MKYLSILKRDLRESKCEKAFKKITQLLYKAKNDNDISQEYKIELGHFETIFNNDRKRKYDDMTSPNGKVLPRVDTFTRHHVCEKLSYSKDLKKTQRVFYPIALNVFNKSVAIYNNDNDDKINLNDAIDIEQKVLFTTTTTTTTTATSTSTSTTITSSTTTATSSTTTTTTITVAIYVNTIIRKVRITIKNTDGTLKSWPYTTTVLSLLIVTSIVLLMSTVTVARILR